MARLFSLSDTAIKANELRSQLESVCAGAVLIFEGVVRNHNEGRNVHSLRYEAYEAMAMSEGETILKQALAQFKIEHALCVHRVGDLAIGDIAVWVGVSAEHRDAAYEANRFIIDTIKQSVPIWKHERYRDKEAHWVTPSV